MARAPISVIIPTLNSGEALAMCLATLSEGLGEGLIRELIITDGGSTDVTQEVAREAGAELVSGPASRGGQLRRGCEAASGEWLLVLHADSQLDRGWCEAVLDHLRDAADDAGYFRLRFRAKGFGAKAVAGWANLRSRVFGLPYGDQGLLISRELYDLVGGYPDIPLMEDVSLVRAAKGRLSPLNAIIRTSAERYEREGWFLRGGRNLWMLLRYFFGADPLKLSRGYERTGS